MAKILYFFGKIRCCPPMVNSPNGNPQATKIVIMAIMAKSIVPVIGNMFNTSPDNSLIKVAHDEREFPVVFGLS